MHLEPVIAFAELEIDGLGPLYPTVHCVVSPDGPVTRVILAQSST